VAASFAAISSTRLGVPYGPFYTPDYMEHLFLFERSRIITIYDFLNDNSFCVSCPDCLVFLPRIVSDNNDQQDLQKQKNKELGKKNETGSEGTSSHDGA
jgi:hypothetical protein